jgi:hypothetical protein
MVRRTMRRRMTKRGKMTKRRKTKGGTTLKRDSVEKRKLSLIKKYRKDAEEIMAKNKSENQFGFIPNIDIGHNIVDIDVDDYKHSIDRYGFPERNKEVIKASGSYGFRYPEKKSSSIRKQRAAAEEAKRKEIQQRRKALMYINKPG